MHADVLKVGEVGLGLWQHRGAWRQNWRAPVFGPFHAEGHERAPLWLIGTLLGWRHVPCARGRGGHTKLGFQSVSKTLKQFRKFKRISSRNNLIRNSGHGVTSPQPCLQATCPVNTLQHVCLLKRNHMYRATQEGELKKRNSLS